MLALRNAKWCHQPNQTIKGSESLGIFILQTPQKILNPLASVSLAPVRSSLSTLVFAVQVHALHATRDVLPPRLAALPLAATRREDRDKGLLWDGHVAHVQLGALLALLLLLEQLLLA